MSEVLAPAGSYESLLAAVRCGADAVYLGSESFNARGNAKNFGREELAEAVEYCHKRGVKVYLTLNTLISDEEQKEAEELISFCGKIGIDAFIIQDLSLVEKIKRLAPAAHLHASTQMSVQTSGGINFLESIGFSRAVVPRELTKREIENLRKNCNIELEVFVHGALCMSVSGQCYMSAMLGSRSGNRGLCAQPCRLPFSAAGSERYDLSLKDNSLIPYLNELEEMGIESFKIEGRMKRPEYVAAAVTCCKNRLLHKTDEKTEQALRAVFSRSGFTDGYYTDNRNSEMFGTRLKEDVVSAKDVLESLSLLYEKEKAKFKMDFHFKMCENENVFLRAECGGICTEIVSDCKAEKAINREITEADIVRQLSKLGGTQFYSGKIEADISAGLSVPLSVLNKLRREAVEKISEKILEKNTPKATDFLQEKTETFFETREKRKIEKTYLFFKNENQIPDKLPEKFTAVLPLNISEKAYENLLSRGEEVCCDMPRGIFGNEEKVKSKVKNLLDIGVERFFCATLDSAVIVKNAGGKITAGFGSNIFNGLSLNLWEKHFADEAVLSPEMTVRQINGIKNKIKTGIICYGNLPLMLTRNCPVKNVLGCDKCKKSGKLVDRKGFEFAVDCSSGTSEILNSVPIYIFDELSKFKTPDFCVLFFTRETKDECQSIIEKYILREKSDEKFTRGLYFRGVI